MIDADVMRASFSGGAWLPGDAEFEALKPKYALAGEPAVFLRPQTSAQLAEAIRYAGVVGLPISIRSGGHGAAIFPNPGGVVIDLGRFDTIEVGDGGRVRLGAGVTWGDAAAVLGEHGLGISAGDTKQVGVGGLTLGGGIGWMVRQYGLALDHLIEADLVTASGVVVRASGRENPELFWALRGGGGNFGVVTHFTFQAHPLAGVVAGHISLDPEQLPATIRAWRDAMRAAPERLNATLASFPSFGPDAPAGARLLVCYAGDDRAAADAALAPLLALPGAGAADIAAKRYVDVLEEAAPPPPGTIVAENGFLREVSDEAVDAVLSTREAMLPSVVMMRWLGGAFSRVPADATAFALRDAEAWVFVGSFLPPDATAQAVQKRRDDWQTAAPFVTGTYGNFRLTTDTEIVARMYPPATQDRLLAVKREWDPDNVFRVNHNLA